MPASLCFVAGAAWGLHETLMHHNGAFFERFPGASRTFWGAESWRNKYNNPWYVPVQISDGKHIAATLHHVALFTAGISITLGERRPAWHYAADAALGLASYSVGNWLVWDVLF